jgi:hypothetical protein
VPASERERTNEQKHQIINNKQNNLLHAETHSTADKHMLQYSTSAALYTHIEASSETYHYQVQSSFEKKVRKYFRKVSIDVS